MLFCAANSGGTREPEAPDTKAAPEGDGDLLETDAVRVEDEPLNAWSTIKDLLDTTKMHPQTG